MKRPIANYHKRVTLQVEVTQWHHAYHKVAIAVREVNRDGVANGTLSTEIEVPWKPGEFASVADAVLHAFARMMTHTFGQAITDGASFGPHEGGAA